MTDVTAGLSSVVAVVLFLRAWHPKTRFLLRRERTEVAGGMGALGPGAMAAAAPSVALYRYPFTLNQTLRAWGTVGNPDRLRRGLGSEHDRHE